MKKISLLVVLAALMLASCYRVDPGSVGIRVDLTGNEQGELQVYPPGRHAVGVQTRWFQFPVFRQNYVWTAAQNEGSPTDESFSFPVEGLVVQVDVGVEFSLDNERITDIFTRYRRGVDELVNVVIRNQVRDAFNRLASDYTMDDLISGGIEQLITEVEQSIIEYFEPDGIFIHSLSLVNAPRYPQTVQRSIEAKIEATQRATQRENELREAEAQAAKDVAEAEGRAQALLVQAQAEAEANRIRSNSLTNQILESRWIEQWDGQLPEVISGDAELLLNIP